MKTTPQQEKILEIHRDMKYHCSTEYEFIRDHRKRISELNAGYLKGKGYELKGVPCDGRCGKKHSSTLFMRRAEAISKARPTNSPLSRIPKAALKSHQTMIKLWEQTPA